MIRALAPLYNVLWEANLWLCPLETCACGDLLFCLLPGLGQGIGVWKKRTEITDLFQPCFSPVQQKSSAREECYFVHDRWIRLLSRNRSIKSDISQKGQVQKVLFSAKKYRHASICRVQ
jgi:hypothetical protein